MITNDTSANFGGAEAAIVNASLRSETNQFGASFGGSILKNKAFFFIDYEGYRQANSSAAFATFPNATQRSGSLGVPVRNPFTGEVYQNGVIPANAVIRYARGVIDSLPANTSAAAANNYQTLRRITDHRDKGDSSSCP